MYDTCKCRFHCRMARPSLIIPKLNGLGIGQNHRCLESMFHNASIARCFTPFFKFRKSRGLFFQSRGLYNLEMESPWQSPVADDFYNFPWFSIQHAVEPGGFCPGTCPTIVTAKAMDDNLSHVSFWETSKGCRNWGRAERYIGDLLVNNHWMPLDVDSHSYYSLLMFIDVGHPFTDSLAVFRAKPGEAATGWRDSVGAIRHKMRRQTDNEFKNWWFQTQTLC